MTTRPIHPLLAALIAYPFAAWLTMGGMFFAAANSDHDMRLNSMAVVMNWNMRLTALLAIRSSV